MMAVAIDRELRGWKSIAGYLKVSKTTAMRLADEYEMPALKLGNGANSTVIIHADVLDHWWRTKVLKPRPRGAG